MSLFSAKENFVPDPINMVEDMTASSELRHRLARAEAEIKALRDALNPLLARIEGEEKRLSQARHLIVIEGATPLQRLDAVLVARNEALPEGIPAFTASSPTVKAGLPDETMRLKSLEDNIEALRSRIEQMSGNLDKCRKRNQALALELALKR